ncbi:MAG: alkaline phosphatase family protein [Flavobacteriales bacterium TMED288]|nr:alkaline phosphatase [Flavobacteriales bacterium]RPG53462.1 MAG: alkaline phosphatase family protein [Flavobacteriales bacterium TMED288]
MKKLFYLLFLINTHLFSQENKPKLIIGLIVDQMRYDYINRFWDDFSDGGFKKIQFSGFNCKNASFRFIPTYTAPGHATIFTGTNPTNHGIIANNWYERDSDDYIYCVGDNQFKTIGSDNDSGKKSPRKMLTSTFGDELRLSSMFRSKVIGISLKDRAAILTAGHTANYALWFDSESGNFVTSSYYISKLPVWLENFNNENYCKKYLDKKWNLLLNPKKYDESLNDNSSYEQPFKGEKNPKFPYDLKKISQENGLGTIKYTPYGNSLIFDLAKMVIKEEELGNDDYTDLLSISLSSTDYIGHKFGVDSKEIHDTYLRLDKDLDLFLIYLDEILGIENILIFLTSDHGAVRSPSYLNDRKVPSGYFNADKPINDLKEYLNNIYGFGNWIKTYGNTQIYLNRDLIFENFLDLSKIQTQCSNFLIKYDGIKNVISANVIINNEFSEGNYRSIQQGYNQKRSGDILLILEPGWIEYEKLGTTHGSGYSYDQHVPLIWYGWDIKPGTTSDQISISDVAPTLSNILEISFPNGTSGNKKIINIPFNE